MASFSDDILTEILLRVPAKSLIRFKCVSRQWRSLISNPQFIRSQLQSATLQKPYFGSGVLLTDNPLQSISIESLLSHPNAEAPVTTVLEFPVQIPRELSINVVGSCNGLICVRVGGKSLLLLNPTSRECRELPNSKLSLLNGLLFYGLGYDSQSDDYKLVWGSRRAVGSNSSQSSTHIFSLRTNFWRDLQDGSELRGSSIGVYASGCLHWLVSGSGSEPINRIISFDLSEEKFHETVPMTGIDDIDSVPLDGLIVSGECLLVYRRLTTHFEAWTMKRDRKDPLWTMLCSVLMDVLPFNWFNPIAFTDDGSIISADLVLCIYNSKKNKVRSFEFDKEEAFFGSSTYVESLVSPCSNSQSLEDEVAKGIAR